MCGETHEYRRVYDYVSSRTYEYERHPGARGLSRHSERETPL